MSTPSIVPPPPPYSTPTLRHRALVTRDPLAASSFIYAVKSTRIYCRPGCPSRLARRANICLFDTAAQAAEAGYRPCKRCRPDVVGRWDPKGEVVRKACGAIRRAREEENEKKNVGRQEKKQGGGEVVVGEKEVAKEVGLSKWYLGRVFRRRLGVGVKEWLKREEKHIREDDVWDQFQRDRGLEDYDGSSFGYGYQEREKTHFFDDPYGILAQDTSDTGNLPSPIISDMPWPLLGTPINTAGAWDVISPLPTTDISSASFTAATTSAMSLSTFNPPYPDLTHIYYIIRPTTAYGYILVAFKMGVVCMLQIGDCASELYSLLIKEYPLEKYVFTDIDTVTWEDIVEKGLSESASEWYKAQIDNILEALERPTGKMVEAVFDLG